MRSSSNILRLLRLCGAQLVGALALLMAVGCGSSTKPKPAGSSTYSGALEGPTISGKLTVTIAADAALTSFAASGTFTQTAPSAQTVTLSGNYDDSFHALALTGSGTGGAVWLVTASPESYGLSGFADSDTNNVASEFTYHALFKATADVSVFLGTYTVAPDVTPTGNFGFAIRGAEVRGDEVAGTGVHASLVGTYGVGGVDSIKIANPSAGVVPPLAAGRLVGTTASGNYYDSSGAVIGTWTGTKQP